MERQANEITGAIVDAAVKLHTRRGPGLLESVYRTVLGKDLKRRGFKVVSERPVTFEFEGVSFEDGLRVDLLVDDIVVVELKSVERLAPVHAKQVLTYLRLLDLKVGLLINFGASTLREGLHRIVNNYPLRRSRNVGLREHSAMNAGVSQTSTSIPSITED